MHTGSSDCHRWHGQRGRAALVSMRLLLLSGAALLPVLPTAVLFVGMPLVPALAAGSAGLPGTNGNDGGNGGNGVGGGGGTPGGGGGFGGAGGIPIIDNGGNGGFGGAGGSGGIGGEGGTGLLGDGINQTLNGATNGGAAGAGGFGGVGGSGGDGGFGGDGVNAASNTGNTGGPAGTGGSGGIGGAGGNGGAADGGGGGITGDNMDLTVNGTVSGGNGGNAGAGGNGGLGSNGGTGGVGGHGSDSSGITNGSTGGAGGDGGVGGVGGNGGNGGAANGGGAGIAGDHVSLTINGTVSGGNGGNGGNGGTGGTGGAGGDGGIGGIGGNTSGAFNGGDGGAGGRGGTGGLGGNGGNGGNGGDGGNGVVGNNVNVTIHGTVNGGNGGVGGNGGNGGGAGNGGNSGAGGNGGAGGNAGHLGSFGAPGVGGFVGVGGTGGAGGTGGEGIVGSDINAIVGAGGTVSGGIGSGGRANAIHFTGGTNVLELQSGFTITGNVVGTGTDTFRLGGTANGTFDVSQIGGQYQGFGSFQKTGTSTWTLTGTSTLTGPTTVNGGTLSVNGSIASSILTTVNTGGTLGGNGTVGNTSIVSGGTLSPGNSIGTITVAGNLVLSSAAVYLVEVSPSAADRTNVTGIANLGGTVQAVFAPGSYVTKNYTILHAEGGRSGTFAALDTTDLPAGFAADLSYTTDDVSLNLTATLGALPGAGLNTNQRNVADALNGFFNNGGALPPNFFNVFGLSGANLANVLSQLSGEVPTGAQQGAFMLGGQFLGLMLDPFVSGRSGTGGASGGALGFAPERQATLPDDVALAYANVLKAPVYKAPPARRWGTWGAAYGGTNTTDGNTVIGSHDLTARAGGIAAGMDYRLLRDTVVGFALAGGATRWALADGLGTGRGDAFQAGVYGVTHSGPLYLGASLAFTNHWMSTDRFALGNRLTADFDAQSYAGRIEGGWRIATAIAAVTPYTAVQAQSFHTPAYREVDPAVGGFGLAYDSRNAADTRSELGARVDRQFLFTNAVLALRGKLAWAHDWVSDPNAAAVFQSLPGASFIVNGASPAEDSALISAGAEIRLAGGLSLAAKFDGEFADGSQTYAGTGVLKVTW